MQVSNLLGKLATGTAWISQASRIAYFDPMDTNRDGKVSVAEAQAHLLKHPNPGALPRQDSWAQNRSDELDLTRSKVPAFAFRDARDINGNGTVSPQEEIAYSLQHPEGATNRPLSQAKTQKTPSPMGAAASQYSSTGALTRRWGAGASSFNLFA